MIKTKLKRTAALVFGLSMITAAASTAIFSRNNFSANAASFTSDLTKEETLANGDAMNQKIAEEGMVLLKNGTLANGSKALPVAASGGSWFRPTKTGVSVFGKHADKQYFVYSGGVSSGGVGEGSKDIYDSLEDAGYNVNPALRAFYADDTKSGAGTVSATAVTETPVSSIEAENISYDGYKEVAIVLVSRTGGENQDLSRNTSEGKHMLELSNNEIDLIKYVKQQGFTRVVLVINSISFEMDFLDDEELGVDAAIWVSGGPGRTGMMAFGKILSGKVNPSGRLADIAYSDFLADPTSYGFFGSNNTNLTHQDGTTADASFYIDQGSSYVKAPNDSRASAFTAYNEGIYVGYRYYETVASDIAAGKYVYMNGDAEDGKLYKVDSVHAAKSDKVANANAWYDDSVVFPFGYGLSYTSFKWELVDQSPAANTALTADGKIELKVKVTNTGSVAGKDVVQLYYGAPYIEGQIEKAAVNLGDYAKTNLLQPGQSQTLTLSLKVRDMASYDFSDANNNGFKGYELDAGNYNIFVGKNSNDSWRNTEGIKTTYSVAAGGIKITNSEYTNYEIKNQYDNAVGPDGILQQMSRSDMVATFPRVLEQKEKVVSEEYLDTVGFNDQAQGQFTEGYAEGKPYESTTMPTQAEEEYTGEEEGIILLSELADVPKDDPKWDAFLNQLTFKQMEYMVSPMGSFEVTEIPALGIPRYIETDGPYGFVGNSNVNEVSTAYTGTYMFYYCSSNLTGATWNDELIERLGETKGDEGLVHGINAIYAPGCNTHRSLFEGRNTEYYSEDPLLNGRACADEVKGIQSRGVIAYVKHYAVREEENEAKITRFLTEQALREIYLKPFQLAVEEGGALGLMVSNNPIGETWWCGADYALCTEIPRNEWGFEGIIITDWAWGETKKQDGITSMLLAGTDKLMWGMGSRTNFIVDYDDPTICTALRNAAHNILFAVSRSNAMVEYTGEHNLYATGENFTANVQSVSSRFNGESSYSRYTETTRTYNIVGDLPNGFTCTDGVIVGNAEKAAPGKYEIVVEALLNGSVYRRDTVNIYIAGLAYEGGQLTAAKAGTQYIGTVATADSIYAGGVDYEVVDGVLPEGLAIDGNGMIYGTPVKAGEYTFTVAASAKGVKTVETIFTLKVEAADAAIETPDYEGQIKDLEDKVTDLQNKITELENKEGSGCNGSVNNAVSALVALSAVAGVIAIVAVIRKKRADK